MQLFWKDRRGSVQIEWVLIAGLISMMLLWGTRPFGTYVNDVLMKISNNIGQ